MGREGDGNGDGDVVSGLSTGGKVEVLSCV